MLLSTAITGINYALRGTDDEAPNSGTDEYNYWLATLNRVKDGLFNNVKLNRPESYAVGTVDTIIAHAAPSYELDTTFIAPSGDGEASGVYVITTTGQRIDFELIKPEERSTSTQAVFIAGVNPQVLYFTKEITATDQIFGGTLYVAGYFMPADLVDSTDVLPFRDPQWAVLATAAEIAYNDIVYEDRAEGLNTKANSLFAQMTSTSQRGVAGRPRKVRSQISGVRGY